MKVFSRCEYCGSWRKAKLTEEDLKHFPKDTTKRVYCLKCGFSREE